MRVWIGFGEITPNTVNVDAQYSLGIVLPFGLYITQA